MNKTGYKHRFSLVLFLMIAVFALTSCGLGVPQSGRSELEEKMSKLESEKAELEQENELLRLETVDTTGPEAETTPETAGKEPEDTESDEEQATVPSPAPEEEPVTETLSQEEKEHLPPRKVFMEVGEEVIEVSMPTFKNLAEQESFVKQMNEKLLTVSASFVPGAHESTEPEATFDGEIVPPEQTRSTEVPSDPNYKAEEWGFLLVMDEAAQARRISLLEQETSEHLRRLFSDHGENNAVKTKISDKLDSNITFTDGFQLMFDSQDLESESENMRFVSGSGEVYDLMKENEFVAALLNAFTNEKDLLTVDSEIDRSDDRVKPKHSLLISFEGLPSRDAAKLVLENPGEETWNYFDDYLLYRYNGRTFEPVSLKEGSVMEWKSIELNAGDKVVIDLKLNEYFGELPRGLYYLQKNIVNTVVTNNLAGAEFYTIHFILP